MYLESTIRSIRDRLGKPVLTIDEIQDLELQLTLAESALEHYRQAYALELTVAGPEPPHNSHPESESGASMPEKRKSERNKDGLTHRARRSKSNPTRAWALRLAAARWP
jgi:hypothetical protein